MTTLYNPCPRRKTFLEKPEEPDNFGYYIIVFWLVVFGLALIASIVSLVRHELYPHLPFDSF